MSPGTMKTSASMLFPLEDDVEDGGDEGADRALGGVGDRGARGWLFGRDWHRLRRDDCYPGERDGGIELHHRHNQAGATELAINYAGIKNAVPDVFAADILIGTRP